MKTFSALLAICAGNLPVTGELLAPRPVTRSFIFSLICARINGWVNNRENGDLRRFRAHYDVTVVKKIALNPNLATNGSLPFDYMVPANMIVWAHIVTINFTLTFLVALYSFAIADWFCGNVYTKAGTATLCAHICRHKGPPGKQNIILHLDVSLFEIWMVNQNKGMKYAILDH